MPELNEQFKTITIPGKGKSPLVSKDAAGNTILNNKKLADLLAKAPKTPGGSDPKAIKISVGVDF